LLLALVRGVLLTKGHGAKADQADFEVCLTELSIDHGNFVNILYLIAQFAEITSIYPMLNKTKMPDAGQEMDRIVNTSATKKLLTPNDVAELLMVSPTTVRFWAQKGALKALTTPGGHRRFNIEDVEEFAASRGMRLQTDNSSLRVLIIDDDIALGHYLVEFLGNMEGVETELANYSFEAGMKVRGFQPHVVLLDLMMPGLDGFQVCQMMKADRSMRNIRVIAMTGFPSDENVSKILSAGAEICLTKPVDEAQLISLLNLKKKA